MPKYPSYLILGAGRSGIAAAKFLSQSGIPAQVYDLKPLEALEHDKFGIEEILTLEGITCHFGQNPNEDIVDKTHCIISSPGIPPDIAPLMYAKQKNIPVISEIEFANEYYKGKLVAVTGTNGKTTTTALTASLLSYAGYDSHPAGNIGDAYTNYALNSTSETILVLEISSFQLDETVNFAPNCAIITNITPDHLDRHGTMENYIKAKAKVFENMNENDLLIANLDDPTVLGCIKGAKCKIAYFSLDSDKDADAWLDSENQILVKINGEKEVLAEMSQLKIFGQHNAANAMAASLASIFMGASIESIRGGLKEFAPVEHRLEFVREVNGIRYVNDSKGTNPEATITALKAVTTPIVAILGGYDKHSEFSDLGDLLKEKARKAVVIGETKKKIAEMLSDFKIPFETAETFEEAFIIAANAAQSGDTVLLSPACASWDMFDNYEERGRLFKSLVHKLKQ